MTMCTVILSSFHLAIHCLVNIVIWFIFNYLKYYRPTILQEQFNLIRQINKTYLY